MKKGSNGRKYAIERYAKDLIAGKHECIVKEILPFRYRPTPVVFASNAMLAVMRGISCLGCTRVLRTILNVRAATLALSSRRPHFAGSVSKVELREVSCLCDMALMVLRDLPLFRHVLRSKIFEAMATERAIILGVKGESEGILRDAGAGTPYLPRMRVRWLMRLLRLRMAPRPRRRWGGRATRTDQGRSKGGRFARMARAT